jgi:hypothetical protein
MAQSRGQPRRAGARVPSTFAVRWMKSPRPNEPRSAGHIPKSRLFCYLNQACLTPHARLKAGIRSGPTVMFQTAHHLTWRRVSKRRSSGSLPAFGIGFWPGTWKTVPTWKRKMPISLAAQSTAGQTIFGICWPVQLQDRHRTGCRLPAIISVHPRPRRAVACMGCAGFTPRRRRLGIGLADSIY